MSRRAERSFSFLSVIAVALLPSLAAPSGAANAAGAAATPITCKTVRTDAKLAKVQYKSPADALVKYQLGPVQLSTYNPVTMNEYVNRTNLYFNFTNTSAQAVTVQLVEWQKLLAKKPKFIMFLDPFTLNDVARDDAVTLEVPAGATKTMEIYISKDLSALSADPGKEPKEAKGSLTFTFAIEGTTNRVAVPLTFYAYDRYGPETNFHLTPSARLQGKVTDASGKPIAGAQVSVAPRSGRIGRVVMTKADGSYSIDLTSTPGLQQFHGKRPVAEPWEYSLSIDKPGYSLAHSAVVNLGRGEVKSCSARLAKVTQLKYRMTAEVKTNGPEGFWKLKFFGNGDRIVGIKGTHDPYTGPNYLLAITTSGKELWRYPLANRCWGLDVSADGKYIGVECDDKLLRVLDANGKLLHEELVAYGLQNPHTLAFSPDSTKLVADVSAIPVVPGVKQDGGTALQVLDLTTWKPVWTDLGFIPYHAYWTNTPAQIVVGDTSGRVRSYTADGKVRWEHTIAYTPIFLAVDDAGRVYAGGKARDLFAWDANGNELFRFSAGATLMREVDDHGVARDGSLVIAANFDTGYLQALNSQGRILWQRYLPRDYVRMPQGHTDLRFRGPGHNATFISSDGDFVLVGSRANQWVRYDGAGSLQYASPKYPTRKGYPVEADYIALQPSVSSLLATDDGKFVAAGFSDSTIRLFELA